MGVPFVVRCPTYAVGCPGIRRTWTGGGPTVGRPCFPSGTLGFEHYNGFVREVQNGVSAVFPRLTTVFGTDLGAGRVD